MRKASVFIHGTAAGTLEESEGAYTFSYLADYHGQPLSLSMPLKQKSYRFSSIPPFFDGLLPEGEQLEALLQRRKLDARDSFGQLLAVGGDLVGAVTIEEET